MSDPAYQTASRDTVRRYLAAAYIATPDEIAAALNTDEARQDLADAGPPFNSHAYYPGDKIAARAGWAEDPDYDEDEGDDEDDE